MRTIIDSDNYAASGIETLFFPGGEPHAKVPKFTGPVLFHLKARTWNDVGIGACVWSALRNQENDARLFLPYVPGARQDRTDGTAPLTKGLISKLFSAVYSNIHSFDIHSDLPEPNWFTENWMPKDLGLPQRPDIDYVIAPDAGARERALSFMRAYCPNAMLIQATKRRNPATGTLSNYDLPALPKHGRYLVVDDICDGGGTFLLLAKEFERRIQELFKSDPSYPYQPYLELFVSHGIFSKGLRELACHYRFISTTDSFYKGRSNHILTVHSLQPIVERIANG
jgi:ribose-phosphate pyrophosphokinase